MRERRAHQRREVNHRGMLSFEDGQRTEPCRLVNLSEGGALIQLSHPENLPQLVSLFYDRLDQSLPEVVSAWCMVVRRERNAAAVKFLHVT